MIRTETLRVFVTVAECGNIKEAASRLFRTQSAISMSLKQLEDHLGGALFETDRKHNLSNLGHFVLGVAADLLRDHDRAIHLIDEYASGTTGRLRIASVPSVAMLLLPEMLADFLAMRPGAEIDLVDTDSADVRKRVASGHADLGIASGLTEDPTLVATPLFEDRMALVCREGTVEGPADIAVDWSHLAGLPLILNETTRTIQAPEFQALAAMAKLRVHNVSSLLAMVRAGIGVTLLPGLATRGLSAPLVARPLRDQGCRRRVWLLHRAGTVQSPLAKAFCGHVLGAFPDMAWTFGLLPVLD